LCLVGVQYDISLERICWWHFYVMVTEGYRIR